MDLEEIIRSRGLRITGARQRVVRAIPRDTTFRAEDLWCTVRRVDPELGRATVFRTLNLLQDLGVVERVEEPDGTHRYRLCTACAGEHHHHLICSICGQDTPVRGDVLRDLEDVLERAQQTYGYVPTGHYVQLFGRCPRCGLS